MQVQRWRCASRSRLFTTKRNTTAYATARAAQEGDELERARAERDDIARERDAMLAHIEVHMVTLHYIALHYIALHCIALHYSTLGRARRRRRVAAARAGVCEM